MSLKWFHDKNKGNKCANLLLSAEVQISGNFWQVGKQNKVFIIQYVAKIQTFFNFQDT